MWQGWQIGWVDLIEWSLFLILFFGKRFAWHLFATSEMKENRKKFLDESYQVDTWSYKFRILEILDLIKVGRPGPGEITIEIKR